MGRAQNGKWEGLTIRQAVLNLINRQGAIRAGRF